VITPRIGRRKTAAAIAALAAVVLLAGCASGGTSSAPSSSASTKGGPQGTDPSTFSVFLTTENSQSTNEFAKLAAGACSAPNKALPIDLTNTPSAQMAQKVQLLAGQKALTSIYQASQSHLNPGGDFYNAGQVLDVEQALKDQGVWDQVTPAAQSVMKQIFANTVPTIPLQFNVEGLFYNKAIFKKLGLDVPTTYDQLLSDAAKIKASGVTPFTASGKTGYTISRWIGIYLYRELGPDALQKIKDGTAKLTDPDYVKAAQALQDMGKKGYFPEGITNLDQSGSYSLLLNGQAAMMYGLSNFLFNINDPTQNKVGLDNIGFMPFPAIKGGKGTIDQYPANVGSPNAMNPALYGPKEGAWLKCIATNYGNSLLQDQGAISGFKVTKKIDNVPATTQDIQNKVSKITQTVLWFEALMGQKATSDAQFDAAPLLTGAMSAKDYMTLIQADQSAP
jgi:raffinose/stachyose/melibiose transport system substrate-binding protein